MIKEFQYVLRKGDNSTWQKVVYVVFNLVLDESNKTNNNRIKLTFSDKEGPYVKYEDIVIDDHYDVITVSNRVNVSNNSLFPKQPDLYWQEVSTFADYLSGLKNDWTLRSDNLYINDIIHLCSETNGDSFSSIDEKALDPNTRIARIKSLILKFNDIAKHGVSC